MSLSCPERQLNQLKALARKILGTPKHSRLLDGDTKIFGDSSVNFGSTPGHTPGSQSLLVHRKNSDLIILSGDVIQREQKIEKDTGPSLNTKKAASRRLHGNDQADDCKYNAKFFINHDKAKSDALKLIPAFYD